jgi:anti-sigma factor RsiW
MTGDQWTARLSEYVDDELEAAERDALERHLAECIACEQTVADLRRVTLRAGALGDRAPERDLWPGIADRIGLGAATPERARPLRWRRAFTMTMSQLALAAGVLLAVGAGTAWVVAGARGGSIRLPRQPTPVATGPSVGPAPAGAQQFAGSVAYAAAVADLQRVLDANRSQLDTATVRVIEESLRTIDRAITRAQAALAADPSDVYLNAHLAETMRRKIELMQRAVVLATLAS